MTILVPLPAKTGPKMTPKRGPKVSQVKCQKQCSRLGGSALQALKGRSKMVLFLRSLSDVLSGAVFVAPLAT